MIKPKFAIRNFLIRMRYQITGISTWLVFDDDEYIECGFVWKDSQAPQPKHSPFTWNNWGSIQTDSLSVSVRNNYVDTYGTLKLKKQSAFGRNWDGVKLARPFTGAHVMTKPIRKLKEIIGVIDFTELEFGCLAGFWTTTKDREFDIEVWGKPDRLECRVTIHWGSVITSERTSFSVKIPFIGHGVYRAVFHKRVTKVYINRTLVAIVPYPTRDDVQIQASLYAIDPKANKCQFSVFGCYKTD